MTNKLAGFFTQPETRRILVVDDEAEILQIMEEFLLHSFPESHIVTADDGREALALAVQSQFDIICTDHRMPIMSGAEFVNRVRGDANSPNQHTPILFVTSFIDDAKKSIKFRDDIFFLNKPFDSTNLVLYVDSVMLKTALDTASQRQKLLKLEKEFYEKQNQIIQRARVASYSEFSSGIAHELNNPLAVIEGLAYILEQEQDSNKVREYSKKIIDNVSRMKAIINHLR
ncbi:MAG: response regulator [Oligoflexales bacterium]|nr:response regulator [Oligoflexales bacterium]